MRSHSLELGRITRIMGIVNVTPDSFSQDGQYQQQLNYDKAVRYAKKMVREGADILDIGGESSRPGAERVSVKEELKRIIPVIQKLSQQVDVPISVDTYKSTVAKEALQAGASLVNTIKGCQISKSMIKTVAHQQAGLVLMHMRGNPKNMQKNVAYDDVLVEISSLLKKSLENCLEMGIKSDKIIIDPGIGFGKSVADNLRIINQLSYFSRLGCPVLMGTSRKSFIGAILDKPINRRLHGSVASVCACVQNGAHIVRVHDVAATKDAVQVIDSILDEGRGIK